ncbi:MAG: D-alanyl-D-alanine carboxypeptidase [Clostridia bacterium]|nr:D-alanyl-D-alanine carboxypeptidase [Clostridia bacterium]
MDRAASVWFYHLETETLVLSKNENVNVGAGSSVKIMAGLLFCESLKDRLHEDIYITDEIVDQMPGLLGHSLHIGVGDMTTVDQLLYAALCGSYNDAFYILGIVTAGSIDAFLELMNERAREIGMDSSSFLDLTGMKSGSRTTATDMARLMLVAYENELYMERCNAESFSFSSVKIQKTVYNRNALLCSYETQKYYNKHCNGMSAGSTTADGNCVLTVAKHDLDTYVCVVLGAEESENVEYGYRIVNNLLDWAIDTYAYIPVISPETEICTLPVTVSDMVSEIPVRTDETVYAWLPKGIQVGTEIKYNLRLLDTSLEAPVSVGDFVGYVAIVYGDRVLGTVKLYAMADAERSAVASTLADIQNIMKNRVFVAGLLFFVLAMTAWIVSECLISRHRKHKWDKYFSGKMELSEDILKTKGPKDRKDRF